MKSSFRRNLLIGFSASLFILIISSTASYLSISNLLSSAQWVNHTNEVIIELNKIHEALTDAETGQRGFLLTKEEEFLDPYKDSKDRTGTAFDQVKLLTTDNATQQNNLEELKKLIADRFYYLDLGIEGKKRGETADVLTLKKGKEIGDNVRSLISSMKNEENRLMISRTENLNLFSKYTPALIITAAILALVITLLFYVRVRNDFEERARLQLQLERKEIDIANRINIIKGIADKISLGSYDIRVDDAQSDSLGSVAGSLNKMAEGLQYSFGLLSDKEWLQTGLARLNDIMIGDKTVDVLTQQVTEFIATYTESQVAAFYLYEGKALDFSAGYSFFPDKSRLKIQVGEGLLGQTVSGRKMVELKNIPADSIYISYASGEARPTHVIGIPVFDGYTVKGAIELASLRGFAKKDIEFLTTSAHNIGIAINSAQNRRRLQDLLEETQSQAEELKAQHNELENINSELEVQSEKLQASEEELRVQQEELQQANLELEERSRLLEEKNQLITERNLDIQTKAEQLAQSTKYKSEFLANMSHELRTPLNSILLLSRLMSEDSEKNLTPDQIEYAKVIQSSGNGLLSLIDEILDLSKIEAGKMQLEYHPVVLKGIISEMKGLFTAVAKEKHIDFITSIAPNVPVTVETDKLRLEQIVKNLISNAIKFTSKGSVSLIIENDSQSSDIKIIVKDTGIGIPKDKQDLIFEAFQQADGSTRRKYGGTGLGLSISRELAKLLGGEITLSSEPDKGSEFTITIPLTKSIQKEDPILPVILQDQVEPPKKDNKYLSTLIPENIPDDRNEISKSDKTILIIEDDVNFGKSLLDFARKKGYKGVVAVRGDEGIKLAEQFIPVGILLDIQLPIKSGWEVMEELKSNVATKHIPVHIMSSHEVKRESLMKGAVDFINKPFAFDQMQDVFQKIEYVLKHHPKKVLIVEENSKHAKALAYFLETFDVSLEIKSEVNDAITSLQGQDVDCVILDMGVPNEDAYQTLEAVKRTPGLENLPIIIFTGKSLSNTEELRIKQYADSIVVKTANSYKRIIDEVSLFLHLMEKNEKKEPVAPRFHKLGALDEVLKNKTVLVADDDMRNIFSMTKALEKYQMKVVAAIDGKDALQKLKAHPEIDVVLMDMMMPEMDGYESTRTIRKNHIYRNLPVIAVTAKAMVGDRTKCIEAGASDYITKPVDIDQLLSLLRVWLYDKEIK